MHALCAGQGAVRASRTGHAAYMILRVQTLKAGADAVGVPGSISRG
jgi:hypothetical protein